MMRKLLRIVKDQIGEDCALAMVLGRKSTIWRRAIVNTLLRKRQVKYIDKHTAEQIKRDSTLSVRECLLNRKVWNVVMNGPEVREIGEGTKFEEHRDEWSQKGKKETW